jgi:hypothetical protein
MWNWKSILVISVDIIRIFRMPRYWTVSYMANVAMSGHGLAWKMSKDRALVGLSSDSPFLVTGNRCVERRIMANGF